ncbi:general secretion pathway protein GspE [Corallococcus exiguus]|uniref:General secretion pathway protein GspE n=5 Tax=Myxococcaceae TaxID=31 RepID=A0A7X4Y7G0_9BACT|nr:MULTISPECIES: general secretion pathway protein GspE [Corallococcus]NBC39102.1 general secretion pathway protein GspE [Corallococcus exiguus]RKI04268.1 general secretion pathway protein GspE [Corallococcus sp. AB038B]
MAPPSRNRIADILVKARVIDELQLRSALASLDQWGGRVSRVIADLGLASEETITQAICQGLGMPRVQLGNLTKDAAALARVEVGLAEQKGVFPVQLKDNGKTLVLAMSDPTDLATLDQVAARSRARVVPMVAGDREIEHAILRHYRGQEPVEKKRFKPDSNKQQDAGELPEEEEFKVVDMSGKTVVKRISDIVDPNAAPPPPAAPAPAARAAPAPAANAGSSASDILDEILAGGAPTSEWTEEDLARLQTVQQNQEKSSKILRALLELVFEKGAVQQRELAARMRL